ncbi:hypothetical protein LTR64_000947 [Lithohypha guttulata]|uniref:uncharacterized protein n=1 Tax=Lithohypha guttulata TaxID=1690604 RepID=UPI002DDE73F7|nr:hypothetical protein LTR51_003141 [Lithohypha guttulata]
MASLPIEEKVEFLLQILATAHEFKPNYGGLAQRLGINTNGNAQRRFKGIVEADNKFVLESGKDSTKVVETNGSREDGQENAAATTHSKTPKSRKRSKKIETKADADVEESPTKKAKKSSKKEQVKKETDGEDEGEGEGDDGGDAK